MNILFISPFPPQKDGIADYAYKLVIKLKNIKDISVHVVTFKNKLVNTQDISYIISSSPLSTYRVYKKIKKESYDIVHLQYDFSNYMLLAIPLFIMLWIIKKTTS